MAKKLVNIKTDIEAKSIQFEEYFYANISESVKSFIEKLLDETKTYIFSGIIRDFFVSPQDKHFRDIDIVIEDDLKNEEILSNLCYVKNSFGGYKLFIDNFTIDLWVVKKTWGLNNGQLYFDFDFVNELPKTTFFNFSSILFSLNDKEFIIGKDFLRFLRDKKIDIVLDKNPYPELCIVNSFYYKDKLKMNFGDKLRQYLKENYNKNVENLEIVQEKHFQEIKYHKDFLELKIQEL